MAGKRKQYTPEFKFKVVMESLQRDTTLEEVCRKYTVSSSMVSWWRQALHEIGLEILQQGLKLWEKLFAHARIGASSRCMFRLQRTDIWRQPAFGQLVAREIQKPDFMLEKRKLLEKSPIVVGTVIGKIENPH